MIKLALIYAYLIITYYTLDLMYSPADLHFEGDDCLYNTHLYYYTCENRHWHNLNQNLILTSAIKTSLIPQTTLHISRDSAKCSHFLNMSLLSRSNFQIGPHKNGGTRSHIHQICFVYAYKVTVWLCTRFIQWLKWMTWIQKHNAAYYNVQLCANILTELCVQTDFMKEKHTKGD